MYLLRRRVLLSVFDPQKGVNPSLSVSVLFLGFQSDDLFTGVVVPTTCSLTTCLITCRGVPQQRRIWQGGVPQQRRIWQGGGPTTAWKNPTNHNDLWKLRGDCCPQEAPGARFRSSGTPLGRRRVWGRQGRVLWPSLPGDDDPMARWSVSKDGGSACPEPWCSSDPARRA